MRIVGYDLEWPGVRTHRIGEARVVNGVFVSDPDMDFVQHMSLYRKAGSPEAGLQAVAGWSNGYVELVSE